MNFVVFDLEWNMASPGFSGSREEKEAMPYEIVEIGAVKFDPETFKMKKFQTRIRPELYVKLNKKVAEVTGLTQLSLNTGQKFPDAAKAFFKYCGENYCLCTWSDSDALPLKQNLAFHGLDPYLKCRLIDVQEAFTKLAEPGSEQRTVEYALDFLRIPKRFPFHKAVNDAEYTAEILKKLLVFASEDGIEDFVGSFSHDPDMVIRRKEKLGPYSTEAELLEALSAFPYLCPHCEKRLEKLTDFEEKKKDMEALFSCPEHKEVQIKARLKYSNKNSGWIAFVREHILIT